MKREVYFFRGARDYSPWKERGRKQLRKQGQGRWQKTGWKEKIRFPLAPLKRD